MPGDSRRINGPENVLSPAYFSCKSKDPIALLNDSNLRLDGRKAEESRPSVLKVGIVPEAAGSAYLEFGNTKIVCSVYGPRDVVRLSDCTNDGQLNCDFKFTPYSCKVRQPHAPSNEEKNISLQLQQTLESVVLMHKFPKARLDIFILVLENDGSVIGGALTCAGAALSDAGVEMYDLVVGCTIKVYGEHILIDPTVEEEDYADPQKGHNHGKIVMGMMPSSNQVTLLLQSGEFDTPVLSQCIKDLVSCCQKLVTMVKFFLWQSAEREKEDCRKVAELIDS